MHGAVYRLVHNILRHLHQVVLALPEWFLVPDAGTFRTGGATSCKSNPRTHATALSVYHPSTFLPTYNQWAGCEPYTTKFD